MVMRYTPVGNEAKTLFGGQGDPILTPEGVLGQFPVEEGDEIFLGVNGVAGLERPSAILRPHVAPGGECEAEEGPALEVDNASGSA